jgi:exopolysaccharide biosynthesis WecB/TagA/CpsF family protein
MRKVNLVGIEELEFLGIRFNCSSFNHVVATLREMSRCEDHHFVVTPNVDHFVQLDSLPDRVVRLQFRNAYQAAAMRLCDSRVVAHLACAKGITLPVIAGSDLTAHLIAHEFDAGTKVAVIGGHADMLGQLRLLFPQPEFLQHVPPMGLLEKPEAVAAIADFLAFHKPHYTLLAMGAPRSEIVAERCARDGRFGGVSLCIGASIEFLTGDKTRAPRLVQRLSLEWAHRLISEPRRLWRRYLVDGPRIITIFLRGGLRD